MADLALKVALLITGQFQLPGQPPPVEKPPTATDPGYIEFLEDHSHIIYPALGLLVLVLLAFGVLQAWRTQDLDGLAKAELKREIILELRRQLGGVSAESLSKRFGLENFKMVRILEEMQKDGVLLSHTNTERLTVWRVKGIGPETHGAAPRKRKSSRG